MRKPKHINVAFAKRLLVNQQLWKDTSKAYTKNWENISVKLVRNYLVWNILWKIICRKSILEILLSGIINVMFVQRPLQLQSVLLNTMMKFIRAFGCINVGSVTFHPTRHFFLKHFSLRHFSPQHFSPYDISPHMTFLPTTFLPKVVSPQRLFTL